MEFETNKWYVYKKYGIDCYVPLCWGDNVLEFDSKEAAEDFVRVMCDELGFRGDRVVYDNIAWFYTELPVFNATHYRFGRRVGGNDYLVDVRKEN